MKILIAICILWVLFVCWALLKRDIKDGVIVILFVVICAVLAVLGKRFDYDGDIAALVFAGITGATMFTVKQFSNKKSK